MLLSSYLGCYETVRVPIEPNLEGCVSESPAGELTVVALRARTPTHWGNSVPSIRNAAARGYRNIEVDVMVTADAELIPARWDSLDYFSTCTGWLSSTISDALAGCEYLDEPGTAIVPLWHGLGEDDFEGVFIDMKFTIPELGIDRSLGLPAVAALHERLGNPPSLVYMSYDAVVTEALASAGFRTGHKGYPEPDASVGFVLEAARAGAEMVCIRASSLTTEALSRSRELGLWQMPWESAADTPQELVLQLIDDGVGGFLTEIPEYVQAVWAARCPPR